MAVHLYICDLRDRFLIQKRSQNKKSLPGIWSVTCGAVSSGENSAQAGIREAKEEVGLDIPEDRLEFISRIRRRRSFIDVYFVKIDFEPENCVLQKEEVDKVRVCSAAELLKIITSSERSNSNYSCVIRQMLQDKKLI